jgi:hypothetical protein
VACPKAAVVQRMNKAKSVIFMAFWAISTKGRCNRHTNLRSWELLELRGPGEGWRKTLHILWNRMREKPRGMRVRRGGTIAYL